MTIRGDVHRRSRRFPRLATAIVTAVIGLTILTGSLDVGAIHAHLDIPAFARKYRTTCSTCHTAAPKLNTLGEAFRLNGYRFPRNDDLLRRDRPVPLGADPWRDLWPRSIWPSELPGSLPIAIRIQNDIQYQPTEDGDDPTWNLRFPEEIYLLAGATLGDNIAAFLSSEWSREDGVEVIQAKAKFQDLLPWLPDRSLNLWIGLQNPYLFTFADRQIDRAARQSFLWQTYRVSDIEILDTANQPTPSRNDFQLRRSQPAIELNGLIGGRLFYGLGLAQGASSLTKDNNNRKDLYYKVRYKIGGLGLDGRYPEGGGPPSGGRGQLLDRSLTLEHFGYVGSEPVDGDVQDDHRSFGIAARALYGVLDLGIGYVWGRNDSPWGRTTPGYASHESLFAKGEFLVYPWLMPFLKFETFQFDASDELHENGFTVTGSDQTRVLPGVVALVRQNIRAILELELYTEHEPTAVVGKSAPHTVWFRLDIAF